MGTYPFVNFKMTPTLNIGSTPTLIFGNDLYTCLIDSVFISNVTDNLMLVTVYIAREQTIGTETDFIFSNQIALPPSERIDVLQGSTLTVEAADLLYAYSDSSSNLFNTFVSYRELTELTASFGSQKKYI